MSSSGSKNAVNARTNSSAAASLAAAPLAAAEVWADKAVEVVSSLAAVAVRPGAVVLLAPLRTLRREDGLARLGLSLPRALFPPHPLDPTISSHD
jgi:hypothetical protein